MGLRCCETVELRLWAVLACRITVGPDSNHGVSGVRVLGVRVAFGDVVRAADRRDFYCWAA